MLDAWLLTDAAEDCPRRQPLPALAVLAASDASEEQSAERRLSAARRKMWPTSGREARSVPSAAMSESDVILQRLYDSGFSLLR